MSRISLAAVVVGVCLFGAVHPHAQQGTGELRGRILDVQGGVLPGATVVAKNEATGQVREIVSGGDGSFFMSALTPGVYELTAQLSGFRRYQRTGVRVEVGKTFALDVQLEVGAIDQRRLAGHGHRLLDGADLELDVERKGLSNLDADARALIPPET